LVKDLNRNIAIRFVVGYGGQEVQWKVIHTVDERGSTQRHNRRAGGDPRRVRQQRGLRWDVTAVVKQWQETHQTLHTKRIDPTAQNRGSRLIS